MGANAPPTPLTPGSAVPNWLAEILPAFLKDRPAFTEALYAAAISFSKSVVTVLYAVYTSYAALGQLKGFDVTFTGYLHVLQTGWFAVAAPIVWGLVNGRTAQAKAERAAGP